MLSRSEILITKRFLFSKKTEGYVSIFSWFSIVGISLGVAAIIIVMSVMNGFRSNLIERLIGVNSHINIYSINEKIEIEKMQVGEVLIVSADDPAAEDDISRWVTRNGHELLEMKKDGATITFQIKKVK